MVDCEQCVDSCGAASHSSTTSVVQKLALARSLLAQSTAALPPPRAHSGGFRRGRCRNLSGPSAGRPTTALGHKPGLEGFRRPTRAPQDENQLALRASLLAHRHHNSAAPVHASGTHCADVLGRAEEQRTEAGPPTCRAPSLGSSHRPAKLMLDRPPGRPRPWPGRPGRCLASSMVRVG
jgi:hypothetical protein